jgi:hypothetical protein
MRDLELTMNNSVLRLLRSIVTPASAKQTHDHSLFESFGIFDYFDNFKS